MILLPKYRQVGRARRAEIHRKQVIYVLVFQCQFNAAVHGRILEMQHSTINYQHECRQRPAAASYREGVYNQDANLQVLHRALYFVFILSAVC